MAVKKTVVAHLKVPITPDEVERRKAKIKADEEYLERLKGGQVEDGKAEPMPIRNINISNLEKQLDREKKALEYLLPKEGTSKEKQQALKEFNEAKEYIEKHALTREELGKYPKSDNFEKDSDYRKAVRKSLEMEVGNPKFQQMCEQLKRAAAILEPDNPELRNINNYRRDR